MRFFWKKKKERKQANLLNESVNCPSVINEEDEFRNDLENTSLFKEAYRNGKIPKINSYEMDLLKFCHSVDMRKFLKEEFEKNPTPTFDEDLDGRYFAGGEQLL